ncbi:unnamed protein product [Chironomus riparius]|uniref:Uncharacterized protein n=1 Tax=Chironomus riparius TaxID=315576 RepID=A0A9N9WS82_9DIPT|nr:unnamed protein product [Chironomus riparius]
MKILLSLVLFLTIFTNYESSCEKASCSYRMVQSKYYSCFLEVIPSSDESYSNSMLQKYTELSGDHNGGSDDSVELLVDNEVNSYIFPTIVCEKFKNLKYFYLHYSPITRLTGTCLDKCENLEMINILGTDIRRIEHDSFKSLSKLKELTITRTKIQNIPESLLVNNLNLTEIHISGNKLTYLKENVFKNQINLKVLSLPNNKIEGFPKLFFNSLINLESLNLMDNKIANLSSIWFETLVNLKQLHLSGNLIVDLPKSMFSKQLKLEKLDLSNNLIKFIHDDSLGTLPNAINLQRNKIKGIDEMFILNLMNANKTVAMASNPCTKDSENLSEKEIDYDISPSQLDAEFWNEIDECLDSYVPRNENFCEF